MSLTGLSVPSCEQIAYFVDRAATEAIGLQDCVDFYGDNKATFQDINIQEYRESLVTLDLYYVDGATGDIEGEFKILVDSAALPLRTLNRHNAKVNNDNWATSKYSTPEDAEAGIKRGAEWVVRDITNALPQDSAINPGTNPKSEYRSLIRIGGGGFQFADTDLANVTAEWELCKSQAGDEELQNSKEAMNADYLNTVYNPAVGDSNVTLEQLRASSEAFFDTYVVN